jgi:hypothetical protein
MAGVALLFLLAVVGLRLALPGIVRAQLEEQVSAALGRVVTVEDVALSLLSGQAEVTAVQVGPALPAESEARVIPEGEAVAGFERLAFDLDWGAAFEKQIRFETLALDGPGIRVHRFQDGTIEPFVLAEPAPEPDPPEPPADFGDWEVTVGELRIQNTLVELLDDVEGAQELVRFELGGFGLKDATLRQDGLQLGAIDLTEPNVSVLRDFALGGGNTVAEGETGEGVKAGQTAVAQAAKEVAVDATEGVAPENFEMRLGSLDISKAEFALLTEDGPFEIGVALKATEAVLAEGERFPIEITLWLAGGRLDAKGDLGLIPPAFDGDVKWADIGFPIVTKTLGLELPVQATSLLGHGDLKVAVQIGGEDGGAVSLAGELGLANVAGVHPGTASSFEVASVALSLTKASFSLGELDGGVEEGEIVAKLDVADARLSNDQDVFGAEFAALTIDLKSVPYPLFAEEGSDAQPTIEIASIVLTEPHARGVRLPPEAAEPPLEEAPAPDAATEDALAGIPRFHLAALDVKRGSLDFEDKTVDPTFEGGVNKIDLAMRDLRWPERSIRRLDVKARGPSGSRVSAKGGLRPEHADLDIAVERVLLPVFNAYAVPAGVRIDEGTVTLSSGIGVRGKTFKVDSEIILDDLDIDPQESLDLGLPVPIQTGVALLKDPSGRITLPVAFEADEEELRAQVWPTVLAVLRQALVGAVTLPLKALKGLAPGGAEGDVALFVTTPGSADIPDGEAIQGLAELLTTRPQLAVNLAGGTGPEDEGAMALAELADRTAAGDDLPELPDTGFLELRRVRTALKDHGTDASAHLEPTDQKLLERLVTATPVTDARRQALARARAESVREHLVETYGVPGARVGVEPVARTEAGVEPLLASLDAVVGGSTEPPLPHVAAPPPR